MLETLSVAKKCRILKESHSAEKPKRKEPLGFFIIQLLDAENPGHEKSFKNYGTQRWHPLEVPEHAF